MPWLWGFAIGTAAMRFGLPSASTIFSEESI
jgi:hypothetical protein